MNDIDNINLTDAAALSSLIVGSCMANGLTAKTLRAYDVHTIIWAVEDASKHDDFDRRLVNSNLLNLSKWLADDEKSGGERHIELIDGYKLAVAAVKGDMTATFHDDAKFTVTFKESAATAKKTHYEVALAALEKGRDAGEKDCEALLTLISELVKG